MALWIVATLVAYFVKGICGFANSLIFDTILSFSVNNVNISPIDLLVNYPSNIVMIVKNRKSLDWKIYLPLIALVLAGSLPGALLLKKHGFTPFFLILTCFAIHNFVVCLT